MTESLKNGIIHNRVGVASPAIAGKPAKSRGLSVFCRKKKNQTTLNGFFAIFGLVPNRARAKMSETSEAALADENE